MAAAYSGPGDVVASAVFWFGLRAYTAAIAAAATQKLINIMRASDNHTCDVIVAVNGGLGITANCSSGPDNGATAATFCNATTCSVTTLYDQSGGNNCTGSVPCVYAQATAADQPALTFSCIGSLPCMTFNGTTDVFNSTIAITSFSQPTTTSSVTERTGNFTSTNDFFDGATASQDQFIGFANTTNTMRMVTRTGGFITMTFTANDSAFHALQAIFNGALSIGFVDGSSNSGSISAADVLGWQTTNGFIGSNSFGSFCTCNLMEIGGWQIGFSGTQQSNMNSNQHSYWGF